jgi:Pentapeptide repeats (8 copies)
MSALRAADVRAVDATIKIKMTTMTSIMHHCTIVGLTTFVVFLMHSVSAQPGDIPIKAKAYMECQGPHKDQRLTSEQIQEQIQQHLEWLHSGSRPGDVRRANFCRAFLSNAVLHADLKGADFSSAILAGTDLRGSDLFGADFRGADLRRALLNDAVLFNADLREADLYDADLSDAHLLTANLDGVIFEPKTLPNVNDIAFALNLSQMDFRLLPNALVRLRNAFKEGGYYQQEREITYAINHSRVSKQLYGAIERILYASGEDHR